MASARTTRAPNVTQAKDGVLIKHREFVADVVGSVDFAVTTHRISPSNHKLFGWLHKLAKQYEKYTFTDIKFSYETRCPTSTSGTIVFAVDHNATDAPPVTKQQVMAYAGARPTVPWQNASATVPNDVLKRRGELFVRGQSSAASDVMKDLGQLHICTQGFASGVFEAGELYVEYSCRLRIPQSDGVVSLPSAYITATYASGDVTLGAETQLNGLTFTKIATNTIRVTGARVIKIAAMTQGTNAIWNGSTNPLFVSATSYTTVGGHLRFDSAGTASGGYYGFFDATTLENTTPNTGPDNTLSVDFTMANLSASSHLFRFYAIEQVL